VRVASGSELATRAESQSMMKTSNVIGENYGFIESVFAFLT
jgi:hypothetical protein